MNHVIEHAKKYGYNNFFTHKSNLSELQEWLACQFSGEDLAVALQTMMYTINTLAIMRAQEDANDSTY
jgi:hypothetical protein